MRTGSCGPRSGQRCRCPLRSMMPHACSACTCIDCPAGHLREAAFRGAQVQDDHSFGALRPPAGAGMLHMCYNPARSATSVPLGSCLAGPLGGLLGSFVKPTMCAACRSMAALHARPSRSWWARGSSRRFPRAGRSRFIRGQPRSRPIQRINKATQAFVHDGHVACCQGRVMDCFGGRMSKASQEGCQQRRQQNPSQRGASAECLFTACWMLRRSEPTELRHATGFSS